MMDIIENTLLPRALMIGVDYELFWTLNPKSLKPFIKAFDLKAEYDNRLAWEYGAYVRMAIASCFSKETQYPKKPFDSKENTDEVMSQEEIKKRFIMQANIINSRFGKEEKFET